MGKIRELTCIGCPMGCALTVEIDDSNNVIKVLGNHCKRGEIYGQKECTNPTRIVTSTVGVEGVTTTDALKSAIAAVNVTVVSADGYNVNSSKLITIITLP